MCSVVGMGKTLVHELVQSAPVLGSKLKTASQINMIFVLTKNVLKLMAGNQGGTGKRSFGQKILNEGEIRYGHEKGQGKKNESGEAEGNEVYKGKLQNHGDDNRVIRVWFFKIKS